MMGKRKKKVNSSYNLRSKTQTILLENKQKTWKDIFPKNTHRWSRGAWKDTEHCLSSEKCKSKPQTTMRYHLIPVRMAIMKTTTNNKFGEDVKKREPSYSAGGNVNWCSLYGKQYGRSSRNCIMIQEFHSLGYIPKENENSNLKRYTHSNVHSNIIYSRQDTEAT